MIDIHCHILPGLDDGPGTMDETLQMARIAADSGITTIIATPHHLNGMFETRLEVMKQSVAALNSELAKNKITVEVKEGHEIRLHPRFSKELHANKLSSLNGSRYILLELPAKKIPHELDEAIYEMVQSGKTPVIAHPERNLEIMTAPHKLAGIIEQGAICQLTAHSITGLFGKRVQKLCLEFCRKRLVHLIASDAHNPYRRSFALKEAYNITRQIIGSEWVDYYQGNAARVLNNEHITYMEPEISVKKKLIFWR